MENPDAKTGRNILGIVVLFLLTLVSGGVIGVVTFGISRIIYLILIFPAFMGIAGGLILHKAIKQFKLNIPLIGIVFGVLMGLSIYGTFHYAEYLNFKSEAREYLNEQLIAEFGQTDSQIVNVLFNEILLEETGYTGIVGYIMVMASEGVSIGRVFSGSSMNLGTFFSYIYWLVEFLLIAGVSVSMGKAAASEPFCDFCDDWYGKEYSIGAAHIEQTARLVQILQAHEFEKAAAILEIEADIPSVDVYLQSCSKCQRGNSVLTVKNATFDSKNRVKMKPIYTAVLEPGQREILLKELKRPN